MLFNRLLGPEVKFSAHRQEVAAERERPPGHIRYGSRKQR